MTFFTSHLKNEHLEIKKRIVKLKEFSNNISLDKTVNTLKIKALLSFFEVIVGKYHHAKEELILFPVLHQGSHLNHGGPRCTFFMEYKLGRETPPLNMRVAREAVKGIIHSNSPLTIPLKEHQTCAEDLKIIRELLEKFENKPQEFKGKLMSALHAYIQLLELHIEKEDTCLFVQVDLLLDAETQKELLQKALQLEDEHYQMEIKQCL